VRHRFRGPHRAPDVSDAAGRRARAAPPRRLGLPAIAIALLVVLIGCDAPEAPAVTVSPSAPDSGIRGIVLLSPTCRDPAAAATPCVRPYVARLAILDSDGNKVADVESGQDGRFSVTLPPGDYVITPAPGGDPFPTGQPVPVSVVADEYTDVEVDYDSGLT
jgi:hypothetical protein